jgi:hypothetical protein
MICNLSCATSVPLIQNHPMPNEGANEAMHYLRGTKNLTNQGSAHFTSHVTMTALVRRKIARVSRMLFFVQNIAYGVQLVVTFPPVASVLQSVQVNLVLAWHPIVNAIRIIASHVDAAQTQRTVPRLIKDVGMTILASVVIVICWWPSRGCRVEGGGFSISARSRRETTFTR